MKEPRSVDDTEGYLVQEEGKEGTFEYVGHFTVFISLLCGKGPTGIFVFRSRGKKWSFDWVFRMAKISLTLLPVDSSVSLKRGIN